MTMHCLLYRQFSSLSQQHAHSCCCVDNGHACGCVPSSSFTLGCGLLRVSAILLGFMLNAAVPARRKVSSTLPQEVAIDTTPSQCVHSATGYEGKVGHHPLESCTAGHNAQAPACLESSAKMQAPHPSQEIVIITVPTTGDLGVWKNGTLKAHNIALQLTP